MERAITAEESKLLRADQWFQLAARAVPWIGTVAIVWCIKDALVAIAGTDTSLSLVLTTIVTHNVTASLALLVGGGGCIYGYVQRKLRRDNIERLQGRIRQLEEFVDAKRTSSHLTSRGDTNPLDKIGGR